MMSSETNMENNRIQILKEILLDLHHGASPESVQERFNQHFKGVSALEISMMEHELMSSEDGVTFEDVMSLCNVHANLFKGAIADVEVADADQEGHPVYVFKQENLALRSAILRIRRIIENISKPENEDFKSDLLNGLRHQMSLLGQFHNHYTRKEKLFFPIMERYGHDSPPKVMWGVDDDIRKLFRAAEAKLKELPDADLEEFSKSFEAFSEEFEAMIFKEEAILLMILLETFTQDDWLSIAEESDAYGYAIIKPSAVWKPKRERFEEENTETSQEPSRTRTNENTGKTQIIDTPEGQFTISFTPKPKTDSVPANEMVFKRTPSQIGRNVELCHPPKVLDKVKKIFNLLKSGERDQVPMWFKSERLGKFVYVTYAAVRDDKGDFQGVLEYVQDIQPFFELESDLNRDID